MLVGPDLGPQMTEENSIAPMKFSEVGSGLSPFCHSCSSMYWPCVKLW